MKIVPIVIHYLLNDENKLFEKYFLESHSIVKNFNVNKDIYIAMEHAGLINTLVAIKEDKIVGFIVASTTINPNYGDLQSTVMAIFVEKEYRKYGTAKELIARTEEEVKARGSKLLTISSPKDSHFNHYLGTLGYEHTNNFYGKIL